MSYEIRPARLADLTGFKARECDFRELEALGVTPKQAIKDGIRDSVETWVALADGQIVCFCGINEVQGYGVFVPWLVGSDALDRHARWFLKQGRPLVQRWIQDYGRMFNMVDARNTKARRWLVWLGFQVDEQPVPYGLQGEPFHRFEIGGL